MLSIISIISIITVISTISVIITIITVITIITIIIIATCYETAAHTTLMMCTDLPGMAWCTPGNLLHDGRNRMPRYWSHRTLALADVASNAACFWRLWRVQQI